MSRELLIQGGYVVTVDPELADLPEGDVLVTDDDSHSGRAPAPGMPLQSIEHWPGRVWQAVLLPH